jgi:aminopeptidase-like protein
VSSAVEFVPAHVEGAGEAMYEFMRELFPICRSITGDGIRSTLAAVGSRISLEISEVPSGTQVYDWTVPPEWNIRDAYIAGPDGRRVVDFRRSNLHVVNYSEPVRARMSLDELKARIHTLPEHPDWIPYRTSYYARTWGFCLTQRQLQALDQSEYEVVIDSTLEDGSLTYAECLLPGVQAEEVLFSCHACHPSLANDNLSGVALLTWLAQHLAQVPRRLSYRFLFIPGAIGSLTWLSRNEHRLADVAGGLVAACVGDPGSLTYKRSRRGDAPIDRAVTHVLRHVAGGASVVDFSPYGYDERQFNSPGFNLPMGSLTRTPHGRFPQYHSSADDLDFVQPTFLEDSFDAYLAVVDVLENDRRYVNTNPKGEPQLSKRGLYPTTGGKDAATEQLAMLWVLNQADGTNSLLDTAERADLPFAVVRAAASRLRDVGLLVEADEGGRA